MEQVWIFAAISGAIGVILLFFGLRLMKLAVALIGFLVGAFLSQLVAGMLGVPNEIDWIIAIVGGLLVALIAFAFYRFAITLSIAYFFANLVYAVAVSMGIEPVWASVIMLAAGVALFVIVSALKLVDGFFAFVSAAQGASLLVIVAFVLLTSAELATLNASSISMVISLGGWWLISAVCLTIAGFAIQLQHIHPSSAPQEDVV